MKFRNFILILLLSALLCTTVWGATEVTDLQEWENRTYLYDTGDILDAEEELQINRRLAELSKGAATEFIVVTVNQYGTADENQTATYCHQLSDTGNAVVLLLSFSEYGNSYYFAAYGEPWDAFNNRAYDKVENACVPLLRSGDYDEAIIAYGEACHDVILSHGKLPIGGILICILIGAGLSFLIPMNILKGQLKTVRYQPEASNYIQKDSFDLRSSKDNFLHRNVSRVAKPKNTGGSSRGGSGGGGRGGSF